MKKQNFHALSDEQVQAYRKQQPQEIFQRSVENSYERVEYQQESSLCFWVNAEPYGFDTHWHSEIEIIMPMENTYDVVCTQAEFHLNPGDILMIPGGELHRLIAPESGIRLIYLISGEIISSMKGFSFLRPYLTRPVLINQKVCGPIYEKESRLIYDMCNKYFSRDCLREMEIYSLLLDFFVCYGHFRIGTDTHFEAIHENTEKQNNLLFNLNTVLDYLDHHFTEDITLETIADVAGFSKFYFSRLFKKCSGYNFYEYLSRRRINAAEELLLIPGLNVTDIAMQSGFSSLSTFNRTFRKFKNCTPSEYRAFYNSNFYDKQPRSTT